jgi:hypothetical protein
MTHPDTGKSRIWYVVSPVPGGWQVTFGVAGSPFRYATQAEAELIARGAAKLHWDHRQEPAGARLDLADGSRHVLATYGRVAHAEGRRVAG